MMPRYRWRLSSWSYLLLVGCCGVDLRHCAYPNQSALPCLPSVQYNCSPYRHAVAYRKRESVASCFQIDTVSN